jgi:tetratricopeptide (TPR) repeat protein
MRRPLLALALWFLPAAVVIAQGKVPPRPALFAGADTNEAQLYYNAGLGLLNKDPEKAAHAFYWATQLNPAWPDAFYARRVALLMARPNQLVGYWTGERRVVRDKNVMAADSLYLRALTLNPFFYRKLDGLFFDAILREFAQDAAGTSGNASDIEFALQRYMMQAPPDVKAWRAYSEGRFDEARTQYALAIKAARKKAPLRLERGRLYYQLNHVDSALIDLDLAAEELRKADKKDFVFLYESKGVIEHSLGLVHLRLGNRDAAKEAFARALQEDLSYGPAHVQLGFMALEAKDTATAVSEFDLAAQIAPEDAPIRYQYGFTLQELGKAAEAETQLKRAIELAPFYASPHFALARAYKAQSRKEAAIASANRFLALASRNDPRRKDIEALLASLASGAP